MTQQTCWPGAWKSKLLLAEIPRKDDLDLGNRLVFRFVDTHVPDDYGRVRDVFSSRGNEQVVGSIPLT